MTSVFAASRAALTRVLAAVRHHPDRAALMERLGLDSNSVVLIINTEGDTDVKHYREVVWEGKHPACD